MIDIKLIRENPDYIKKALSKRKVDGKSIDNILELDKVYRENLTNLENLRAQLNKISKKVPKTDDKEPLLKQAQEIKKEISILEDKVSQIKEELDNLMYSLPNIPQEDVPDGGEDDFIELKKWGEPTKFDFAIKDHLDLGEALDIIDVKRATKVSGSRFYYLKGKGALLEFALVNFIIDKALKNNFIPVIPPVLIRYEIMKAMGYIDTPEDLAERYFLEKDNLFLVGTSEQSVGPMHKDEVFEKDDLPRRYIAFSSCFREEAGSYGKDIRGILRVHQFDKVELFSYALPEKSKEEHEFLVNFEESLWQDLKIPYRVLLLASNDMSRPSSKTIDIEAWIPSQNKYREVSSASNTTDFQARRLNIKYKDEQNNFRFVHMLNATGLPIGRTIITIMENYQTKEGRIKVPDVLVKYLGFEII